MNTRFLVVQACFSRVNRRRRVQQCRSDCKRCKKGLYLDAATMPLGKCRALPCNSTCLIAAEYSSLSALTRTTTITSYVEPTTTMVGFHFVDSSSFPRTSCHVSLTTRASVERESSVCYGHSVHSWRDHRLC